MQDARRFLRLVLPGVIYITLVLAACLVGGDIKLEALTQYPAGPSGSDGALGVAVGAIVVSGGLGFLFLQIHFFLYWLVPCYGMVFHRKNHKTGPAWRGFQQVAWARANVLLHAAPLEAGAREVQRQAAVRTYELADLHHGLGATCVAAVSAAVTWIAVASNPPCALWIGWVVLLVVLYWNFRNTRAVVERTDNAMLALLSKYRVPPCALNATQQAKSGDSERCANGGGGPAAAPSPTGNPSGGGGRKPKPPKK